MSRCPDVFKIAANVREIGKILDHFSKKLQFLCQANVPILKFHADDA